LLTRLGATDGESRRELRSALAPLLRRYPCAAEVGFGAPPGGAAAREINRLRLASALAGASAPAARRRSRPVFAEAAPDVGERGPREAFHPRRGVFDGGAKTNNRCATRGRGKRHQNAAVRATPARGAGRQAKWASARPRRNHKARL